jgi:hypothetical protein
VSRAIPSPRGEVQKQEWVLGPVGATRSRRFFSAACSN